MRSHAIVCLVLAAFIAGCPFGSSDDADDVDVTGSVNTPDDSAEGDGGDSGDGDGDGDAQAGDGDGDGDSGDGDGDTGGTAGSAGDGDGDGDGEGMVPLTGLPAAFAGAICDALESCVGESKLRELMRREDCESRVEAELVATDFAHMDMAISTGRVLYDPSKLAECEEGIRDMACDVVAFSFPQACVDVLKGNVEVDGECVISAECAGTAFCGGTDSCPSTCTALLGEDETCSGDSQCADGLRCIGRSCAPPSQVDEPCGGTSGTVCALGLNCLGATDVEIGRCVTNADIQVGDMGDVCEPGGELCMDGLSCVFDGSAGFVCEGPVESGGSCHLGLPGQCPVDEFCDTSEITAEATCEALPQDGEACVLNGLCAPGHACVQEGGNTTCRLIQDNGGACGADAACRSGNCVGGACMPPPACL